MKKIIKITVLYILPNIDGGLIIKILYEEGKLRIQRKKISTRIDLFQNFLECDMNMLKNFIKKEV